MVIRMELITLTLMLMILPITVIYFLYSNPVKSIELLAMQAYTVSITLPTFHLD